MNAELRAALRRMCQEAATREICGYVVDYGDGVWALAPVTNVHKNPERFYTMHQDEALAVWELGSGEVVGEYHSHPQGPARPSTTDLRYAVPGLRHWIVTPDGVHEWETP
jgi:proteasome lid subunit RPN8/RPN11